MAGMAQVYDVEEASLNSSTGSNNPLIGDDELSDDISSNRSCRQIRKYYTPRTICDAILRYKTDRGTIFRAYDWLTSDIKEARLFFDQPENLRMVRLIERMFGKKTNAAKDVGEEEEASDKYDCIFEPREYTPGMISRALCRYPFSRHGFWDAHDLLMSSYKEVVLFFGLPSTLRMGWIMKRIEKRREENGVMREALSMKRKGVDVEEEASYKKRRFHRN